MVPLDKDGYFISLMTGNCLSYKSVSDEEQSERVKTGGCPDKYSRFNFTTYNSYNRINSWFKENEKKFPTIVKLLCLGRSFWDRRILGVKLSFNDFQKPGVFIEGGMHGQEMLSVTTAVYMVRLLLYSPSNHIKHLRENYDWYIFPMVNPDGYVYANRVSKFM